MDEGQKVARGRGDRTPARLLLSVMVVVGVFFAAVYGLVLLIQSLI